MNVSKKVSDIFRRAFDIAEKENYEYITPETMLLAICQDEDFADAYEECGGDIGSLKKKLKAYLDEYLKINEKSENKSSDKPKLSLSAADMLAAAQTSAFNSGRNYVDLDHLVGSIISLKESYAAYFIQEQGIDRLELLEAMIELTGNGSGVLDNGGNNRKADQENSFSHEDGFSDGDEEDDYYDEDEDMAFYGDDEKMHAGKKGSGRKKFEKYASCINDMLDHVNPLIGREDELERTIQILCRKDKNNVIHIGEPGVGKTAITYGLARLINEGKVPDALKGARIYSLDLGSLLAGTQYRGELEKRLKKLLDSISKEENPIIYIDEIHNLAGAGAVGESSLDASNMLKPYLAAGKIRFIGATTFEEYKRHFEKNKSLVRRFQNTEIKEPTVEETVEILQGLKKKYEEFHGVKYDKGVLEYAVQMSKKYINERFLPDKAIDLIDEAGAYRKIHPLDQKKQTVGKDVIDQILTKICRIPVQAPENEKKGKRALSSLEKRMKAKIFGQDEAITQVVNAIKFSKAGLQEENKPLSSFLFAGPTGVGKTEIAKTLAEELGLKLVRFDMSEYGEKHAVAKLIGSPAGYVGYEDGGLLTEAIRKNPSSVLLLDEIEKAHPDIYNILLQVMDYATLTDNQGRKADFRNVIIIMTSNAGASRLGKAAMGFGNDDPTKDLVSEEVKRIFTPEFRNRLNKIVVFSSMTKEMGMLIAGKKLGELGSMLLKKKIEWKYTESASSLLTKKGTSREYGARDMDRIIQNEIKTLLVDEILFGSLKKGGQCSLDAENEKFKLDFADKKQSSKMKSSDGSEDRKNASASAGKPKEKKKNS